MGYRWIIILYYTFTSELRFNIFIGSDLTEQVVHNSSELLRCAKL